MTSSATSRNQAATQGQTLVFTTLVDADPTDKMLEFENFIYGFIDRYNKDKHKDAPDKNTFQKPTTSSTQDDLDILQVFSDGSINIYMAHEDGVNVMDGDILSEQLKNHLEGLYNYPLSNSAEYTFSNRRPGLAPVQRTYFTQPINLQNYKVHAFESGTIVLYKQTNLDELHPISVDIDNDGWLDEITITPPNTMVADQFTATVEYGGHKKPFFFRGETHSHEYHDDVNADGVPDKIVEQFIIKNEGETDEKRIITGRMGFISPSE